VGLRYEILKKIRKRARFEVSIFYYSNKPKKKNKDLPDSLLYVKRLISECRNDSESYFLFNEEILDEEIIFGCLFCVEIGRVIYLEKELFMPNRFSNLEDHSTLQKWLKKQESVGHIYNNELRNRSIDYYTKLAKFKYDLEDIKGNVYNEVGSLKKFKFDIDNSE
jgi:hypothetical protein